MSHMVIAKQREINCNITPLVLDQEVKRPQSPTMNSEDVLCYLKRTTPENRNEVAAALTRPAAHQDFSLT